MDIRILSLFGAAVEVERLSGFLTEEELQRGAKLLRKDRRDRFVAGRGLLREALGQYLGLEPGRVRLSEGEYGKLRVADEESGIRFNISHAGDYLLMVFVAGREVGCDLEEMRRELPYRGIAERYFSMREREELFSLPADRQLTAFYRCWTRKEAYLKGTGTGFSQPSTGFDVSLLPDQLPALLDHRGDPSETARWKLLELEAPTGYCGAIALEI